MLLTDDEIMDINQNAEFDSAIGYARAIESAVLEKLKAQAPYVIEYPDYHQHGMGCGLEDRNIIDRYKAMAYGWDCAIDAMAECIPDRLYEHPLPPDDVVRDAERLDWIQANCRCDPMMDGQHKWWPTNFNKCLTGPSIREAIDAAMKGGAA